MSKPQQMWWMGNPIMDKPRPKYKANLHEYDMADIEEVDPDYEDEFVDAQEEQEDEDADISDEIETDDAGNDKISAFLSKQKRLEPGDIRKGLATARSMSGPVNCQQCCT